MNLNFRDMKTLRLIILLTVIALCSCEETVTGDINLTTIERLVIEGGIERNSNNPGAIQSVKLSTTINYLSQGSSPGVTDATVTVTDGATTWEFIHTGNGLYSNSELIPELNTVYTITIIWRGETYTGNDTLNEVAVFDNFYFEFEEETLFTDEGYFLKFDSTDPAGIENYYYYRVFKNGIYTIVPDPGNSETLIVSDEFFDGQQRFGINPNEEVSFAVNDIATAQQLGISQKYFEYLYQVFEQTGNQGVSFTGNPPPASIRSNVINVTTPSNRPLGFFYAADIEEQSVQITE